jgi:hypothetical protein
MDTDAAKELKELREQNSRLKRLLAEAELVATDCSNLRRRYSFRDPADTFADLADPTIMDGAWR